MIKTNTDQWVRYLQHIELSNKNSALGEASVQISLVAIFIAFVSLMVVITGAQGLFLLLIGAVVMICAVAILLGIKKTSKALDDESIRAKRLLEKIFKDDTQYQDPNKIKYEWFESEKNSSIFP